MVVIMITNNYDDLSRARFPVLPWHFESNGQCIKRMGRSLALSMMLVNVVDKN